MTLLGRLLVLFRVLNPGLEEWLLDDALQFRAQRRDWKLRVEHDERTNNCSWDRGALLTQIRREFPHSKLARYFGWRLSFIQNNEDYSDPLLHIALTDPRDGIPITFYLYYYDVPQFLRACDQIVGLDSSDLSWLLKTATNRT